MSVAEDGSAEIRVGGSVRRNMLPRRPRLHRPGRGTLHSGKRSGLPESSAPPPQGLRSSGANERPPAHFARRGIGRRGLRAPHHRHSGGSARGAGPRHHGALRRAARPSSCSSTWRSRASAGTACISSGRMSAACLRQTPQSNYHLAGEFLFTPARIPHGNVHRVEGELSPAQAAARYVEEIRDFFGLAGGELPRFRYYATRDGAGRPYGQPLSRLPGAGGPRIHRHRRLHAEAASLARNPDAWCPASRQPHGVPGERRG